MEEIIKNVISASIDVKHALLEPRYLKQVRLIAEALIAALSAGGKIITFGNGGSAADAQHMVSEFVGRYKKERKGIPAVSLATNVSSLTAIANDYSYDVSFKRQIEALGKPGDIAVGISTSGNARNVIEAMRAAKAMKMKTVALTGRGGGELARHADLAFVVPSDDTPCIQEAHITIIHIVCGLVEGAALE